jgi:hypothetical protein
MQFLKHLFHTVVRPVQQRLVLGAKRIGRIYMALNKYVVIDKIVGEGATFA